MVFPASTMLLLSMLLLSVLGPSSAVLQIDCIGQNYTTIPDCRQYLYAYMQAYTGNVGMNSGLPDIQQGYYKEEIVFTKNYYYDYYTLEYEYQYGGRYDQPEDVNYNRVSIGLTVNSLNSIDTMQSAMTITGVLTLRWWDYRLSWNETIAPAFSQEEINYYQNSITIPSNWIWTPDIILKNSISSEFSEAKVRVEPNGHITWSRIINVIGNCNLDLSDYPFDTQFCEFFFRSNTYSIASGIKLQEFSPNQDYFRSHISDRLISSPTWKVENLTSTIERDTGTGFYYSMLNIALYAKRYNSYYLIVAIVPNIIVTCIAIISLWIPDIQTRLSIEVTSLLTIMAVLWVIAANVPSTPLTSWLEKFTYFSMTICGVCVFESAISGTLKLRQGNVPLWQTKILVWLSTTRHEICRKYFCFLTNKVDGKYLREMEMVDKNNIQFYVTDDDAIDNHADVEAVKTLTDTDVEITKTVEVEGRTAADRIAFNKFLWSEKAHLLDLATQLAVTIAYVINMARLFAEVA